MSDVTAIIDAINDGDADAPAQLLPLVYDELRRLAAHKLAPALSFSSCSLVKRLRINTIQSVCNRDKF